jgi:hypothetical protein
MGLWKNIRMSWGKFCSHTRFEAGDSSKFRLVDFKYRSS